VDCSGILALGPSGLRLLVLLVALDVYYVITTMCELVRGVTNSNLWITISV
jgi:hypothetical protein